MKIDSRVTLKVILKSKKRKSSKSQYVNVIRKKQKMKKNV